MASFSKRGDKWLAEIRVKGQYLSKTFDTKGEAKHWVITEEPKLKNAKGLILGKTLGDAFERYEQEETPKKKGAHWEAIRLRKLRRDPIASEQLINLTHKDFDAPLTGWIPRQEAEGLCSASILRELQVISPVFTKCRKWKWLAGNPLEDVEMPKKSPSRKKLINEKEIDLILRALSYADDKPISTIRHWIAFAFLFAIETAMRQGEIWKMEWQHINWKESGVMLFDTKNGEDREVPLSLRAIELLQKLGPRVKGKVIDVITQKTAEVLFRRAVDIAGLKGELTFHDTRHLATTRMAEKLDMLALSTVTGHKDPRMLKIYYNPTTASLAKKLG